MLDEKDLQAISELLNAQLDSRLDSFETRLNAKIEQTQRDAVKDAVEQSRQNMMLLYKNQIKPQLQILAEGQETILQQLAPRLDDAEQRIDHLETEVMLLKSAI